MQPCPKEEGPGAGVGLGLGVGVDSDGHISECVDADSLLSKIYRYTDEGCKECVL